MKTKLLICTLLLGSALLALAAKDPVLMTVNGKDVTLSEFEYLYHKNNQQQVEKESLEQYVERFIRYKQKVADAEAAGIDTSALFIKEFDGYKKDLAAPYMEDTTYRWHFIQEAYERTKTEIKIDHMMLPLGNNELMTAQNMQRMDSIRTAVLNGANWEEMVAKYSSDPSKERNKGHYGFISAGVFPYGFENVVYETPVGEISKPFKTDFGIHMIRVNEKRPYEGVHAKHILKLFPRKATDEQKAVCKHQIDSIYQLLKAGADFEEMAKAESQDGSAKRGGDLGWFGRGRMVKPFEDVAFGLNDGEISEPFETQFGWHIVKKVAHGNPTLADQRAGIENAINRDERSRLIRENRLNDLKREFAYKDDASLDGYLEKTLAKNGGYDSTYVATYIKDSKQPLYTFTNGRGDKRTATLGEIASAINPKARLDNAGAKAYILSKVTPLAEKQLIVLLWR